MQSATLDASFGGDEYGAYRSVARRCGEEMQQHVDQSWCGISLQQD